MVFFNIVSPKITFLKKMQVHSAIVSIELFIIVSKNIYNSCIFLKD